MVKLQIERVKVGKKNTKEEQSYLPLFLFLFVFFSLEFSGSLAYDVTLKTFLCQPHQLSAVVGLYHTECSRLDPAKQGGVASPVNVRIA